MRAGPAAPAVPTVEATGKLWKGIQLASIVGVLLGVGICLTGNVPIGFSMAIVSGILFFLAMLGAWWEHG